MSTLPAPTFGELLRQARRAARLTQEELAARAGVSADAISVLERGLTRTPQQETLNLLAEALQLTPEERARWELARRETRLVGYLPLAYRPPVSRRQLPIPTTPLIGREQEVQSMCALLQRRVQLTRPRGPHGAHEGVPVFVVVDQCGDVAVAGAIRTTVGIPRLTGTPRESV